MSRLRSLFTWLNGCHRAWAACFAGAFITGTGDPLWHGWSIGRVLFQAWVIYCGAAALREAKLYMFEGVAFRVESGDPGDDDNGDDGDDEQAETAAPVMPATKEEVRAACCDVFGSECPVCERRARLGVN